MDKDIEKLLRERIEWHQEHFVQHFYTEMYSNQHCWLRMNDFPEEPLWTLHFYGKEMHFDDTPKKWKVNDQARIGAETIDKDIEDLLREKTGWNQEKVDERYYYYTCTYSKQHCWLRMNDFPEKPLWTLHFYGRERHFTETPKKWRINRLTRDDELLEENRYSLDDIFRRLFFWKQ